MGYHVSITTESGEDILEVNLKIFHDYFRKYWDTEWNKDYVLANSSLELCKVLIEMRDYFDNERYEAVGNEERFDKNDYVVDKIQYILDKHIIGKPLEDCKYIYHCNR